MGRICDLAEVREGGREGGNADESKKTLRERRNEITDTPSTLPPFLHPSRAVIVPGP